MPKYDYKCLGCGEIIEVTHKIDETPELICGKCGSTEFKRLIGRVGVVLKGSGWYSKEAARKRDGIPKAVAENAEKLGKG